jgi:soluble lytic murein transglycosylase
LRALNDPAAAMPHFAAIAQSTEHPTGLARAAYWQGRAAEALNRREEARAHYDRASRYPTAYYGQLARARLGAGDIVLHPLPEARSGAERLEMARVFEILYAIGESDVLVPAAADLAERADASALAMLADISSRHKDARVTLLLGKGAVARGLPLDKHAYPIEGLPRYEPVGPAVEPPVAYSIARQESAFNPKAVSSAKAYGLMQVTVPAGKHIAKKLGIGFDQKRLINDPAYNVRFGAAELGDLIESYRGSYILSFAAYNAGRRRVSEWIERYGDPRDPKIDAVDWVERIPFSETRNYVQRVLENLQVYRVRFGASSKLMIEADLRRGAVAN